jgi:hypothetical protein
MMKQDRRFPLIWILSLPLILALISLGCGLSQTLAGLTDSSQPTSTRVPLPTFTPTVVNIVTIDASSTNPEPVAAQTTEPEPPVEVVQPESVLPSPTPSPLPPPTEEPPPVDDGPATVTIQQNMNVRGGPGTNYPVIGPAPAGSSSKILGRIADNSWVQVEYPPGSGGTGWVYAPLVKISGDLESVPIVNAPAPPASQPSPEDDSDDNEEPAAPPPPQYQFTPAAWSTIGNAGIIHFRGTIRDHAGNPVNGFSALLDNGSWSVLSHPTGASHHYPDRPEGEWDVVIPDVSTGVGWWKITIVSYDCPDFNTVFDAQCKQFTRLSEDVPVSVTWPDETVIWADWTCNWDCDKGLYVQSYRRP